MFRYSSHFALLLLSLSMMIALISAYFSLTKLSILLTWPFFNPYLSLMTLDFYFDAKGTTFAAVVLFISGSVLLFSSFYMEDDLFLTRFIILVVLFVMSMNLLIFIPNMIAILLGWDGLGIISFCLVIYYQNPKSLAGGMLTALSNRIGDVMILIAIALMLNNGSWLITNPAISKYSLTLTILILIAAMTKSAQIPFSSWLPAAMAAPTPVSALVHSSTLVTAGVFLLIRFYPFLSLFPEFKFSLLIISVSTLTMAGMSAMSECDLKKIIALSTLSQLGVMMMSLALGLVELAFFHLLTHAMFKALLFMSAGTLLHLFSHNQDLRGFGNLSGQLPFVVSTIVVANLALCGFPFMAGFYSKDLILEFMLESSSSFILLWMAMGATFLTSAYSIRLSITAVWSPMKSTPFHSNTEKSPTILLPLTFLSIFAIMGGAILNWLYMPSSLSPNIPATIKLIPLLVTMCGAFIVWTLNTFLTSMKNFFLSHPLAMESLTSMWFLTPLSTQLPLLPSMFFIKKMTFTLDQGWLEMLGPQGAPKLSSATIFSTQMLTKNMPPLILLLGSFFIMPFLFHYLI
uniref:NADH-ubiquinone oxidoreductase chain 5 n=1 Tax=Phascolosoma pacificum TaxID=1634976 RepID=A0A1D8BET6_9ANNE|nr:NADH dehydrogenase subunit 5 [Phascolosoma pacificum]AOS53047.1 NADH dehydrogenase subunit 5 [Phascolosoma pacificum]